VNKNFKLKKSSKLVSAALAGGLAVTGAAAAEENVFAASELPSGYMVADAHGGEGKCGEGKCGEGERMEGKHGEGKCGEGKCGESGFFQSIMEFFGMGRDHAEGKCGEGKCGEGKCGEGKCGEGKCGEGKCGEGKCGEGKSGEDKE